MRKQQKKTVLKKDKKIRIKRLEDELSQSEIEQLEANTELWENGQFGESAKYAKAIPREEEQALDVALGLQLISIRIQKPLIEQLKELATLEGMGYQTFVRQVLTRYVRKNEHKLEPLLLPKQLADNAEQSFMQALELKKTIPRLKSMSDERISAESGYATALSKANELFCQAYEKCNDPILKNHLKLRMSQINDLCNGQSENTHTTKYKRVG